MRLTIYFVMLCLVPFVAKAQVVYDFETGTLEGWLQSPESRWTISTLTPLSGARSLKHSISGADKDRISIALPTWDAAGGTITWRFLLKHGYNPSSSNNWGIFLSCDKDASGMIAASAPNGYAVGVNLTGSDDILKLFKVTNGVFSPIIETTINWEQSIKTSGVGAVEVVRKPDGTYTLKASTTGSFLTLQSYGSILDVTHSFGGYFGVYYAYTSSGAEKLWIDDISINFNPINPNDRDAQVLEPEEQIASGIISSLTTEQSQAVDIFRFTIKDLGTADGLPIRTTRMRFSKVDLPDAADWVVSIRGVSITNSLGNEIPIVATYIMSQSIEVEVDPTSMPVPNGASETFSLAIYLNPGSITENETFQAKVEMQEHGWEADFNGSDFAEVFPSEVLSNTFTIKVIPTHLFFLNYPQEVVVNAPFSVSAYAGDASGSLSAEFSSEVYLSVAQGIGLLTPSAALTINAEQGIATWSNITYSARDTFKLAASAQELTGITGPSIAVTNDNTSIAQGLASQPDSVAISSLVTTPGQAVEVFRFRIFDSGNNDGVPTYVKQITLKRPSGDDLASFSKNIAGIVIKVGNYIIPVGSPTIYTSSITIPMSFNALTVDDGGRVDVSLYIYLNDKGLEDGKVLKFMIDSQSHGFLAYSNGSLFATEFPASVISKSFPVEVLATRLNFSSVPKFVGLGEGFSVEVNAVDAAGNVDIHTTGNVLLSKNTGEGWLTIPSSTATISNGIASWSGLIYYMADPFTLLASSTELNDAVSSLIYCADRTSSITLPTQQVSSGIISSLVVDTLSAVNAFRFKIKDFGTTDGLPTYISQLTFKSFGIPSDALLNKSVGGVVLTGNDQIYKHSAITIESNQIVVTFDKGVLTIPDSEEVELTLKIYLRMGGLKDGETISLYVSPAEHGWQTHTGGSAFPTSFELSVVGPTLKINVEASSLEFTGQPFGVSPEVTFSLEAAYTDVYGNVDVEMNGTAELSLNSGPSPFNVENSQAVFSNGIATWNGVNLTESGLYRFKAVESSEEGIVAISQPVWNGFSFSCAVDENFDLGYPNNFPISSAWNASTVSPIAGEMSLKHALSGVEGESVLGIPLSIDFLGSGPVEWSFAVSNGDWDPTSDNTFWFVLASDTASIRLGEFNGYAVGINLSGATDLLTLWKVTKGSSAQLLIQSDFDWNESETVGIKVTRSPKGDWSLWFQPKYGELVYRFAGYANDSRFTQVVQCGPVYKYTSSRAGEFWLDNLKICSTSYPPIIQSVNVLSLSSVDVIFSEPINQEDAASISKYSIKSEEGFNLGILGAYPSTDNTKKVTLRTQNLPFCAMWLTADGIRDTDGNASLDSMAFALGTDGAFGSVVINEIMAKPSSLTALPEVEYVELYNRTSSSVTLKDWTLRTSDNKSFKIPEVSMEPDSFLLLCTASAAELLVEFGQTASVSSFPSLVNSGMYLAIHNSLSQPVSWVNYSESWYGDDVKEAGGYSLERIDPDNLVEGKPNWIGSNDPSGGTPGRENSVKSSNPDLISPKILEAKVVSATIVEILFSETMDSLSITNPENYTLSGDIGNPIWLTSSGPYYNKVKLEFAEEMVTGEIYDLCFSEGIIDFSSNPLPSYCIPVAVPVEPLPNEIVINEVLFNPYSGGVDFVEIFNNSAKTFDLSKIWIANRNTSTGGLGDFFIASDTAKLLFPSSYAVLSVNPNLVSQFYIVENPSAMVWSTKMPSYSTDMGYVLILDQQGGIVDEMYYTEKMHLQLLSDVKGVSLERIHPNLPSTDQSSWQSASQVVGYATPTARNSQYMEPGGVEDNFELVEKIFSPDGDGYNDILLINYKLPDDGYIASIMIFDSKGRRVRRLVSNLTLGTSGTIKWDGVTDDNRKAPIGAYIVFIEAFSLKNDVKQNLKHYKKTCLVATKFGE